MSFKTLGLSETLLQGIRAAGYTTPTPIQRTAIPVVRSGRDLIGCAQTGTGKTAAFVLPVLDRLFAAPAPRGPRPVRVLVVTPTRELAVQVNEAVRTYGRFTPLRSLAVYGGVGIQPQIQQLRRGVDVVVATPGRLLDHLNRGTLDLGRVQCLVLDEADRMLDMGFLPDVRRIIAALPSRRQTLLFSATMPRAVRELADQILRDPEYVEVGGRRNPAETVTQHACAVVREQKLDLLLHVLQTEPIENVLVFARTKRRADRITRALAKRGYAAVVLHSNRTQRQRQRALEGFRAGDYQVMVATDIAARGIDVDGISHVINFNTPAQAEDYIHRIGRTGRAQAAGDAITFVARDEEPYLRRIEQHTGQRLAPRAYAGFTAEVIGDSVARPSAETRRRPGRRRRTGAPASSKRRR